MHMADALISPIVGGVMWTAAAGLALYSSRKMQKDVDDNKIPLMGVMGAFVFAAQMINFTIPATGSSGHLGGAIMLSILLGPYAAFLIMAAILTIQALFFADGGLLALGCNIINMAFFSCFISYPLIFKPLAGANPSPSKLIWGTMLSCIIGLQLGAFGVVLETIFSGISELSFTSFVLLMQPIHLAIGIVEGLITTAVITFIWKECPNILHINIASQPSCKPAFKRITIALFAAAILTGGCLSWFASANPDGLEWSIIAATGKEELESPEGIHSLLAGIQQKTAFLPDYNFRQQEEEPAATTVKPEQDTQAWPAVDSGTTAAGIIGSILTLAVAWSIGKAVRLLTGNKAAA